MSDISNIPIQFFMPVSAENKEFIQSSPLLTRWVQNVSKEFLIKDIIVKDADIIQRKGEPHLLFLKLDANAEDKHGNRAHGITLLRGDAVAILVVLHCEGEEHLLLVEQPRFAVGDSRFLEIPAGMMDGEEDPREVAVRELEEEAHLHVKPEDLVDLLEGPGVALSSGLLDEYIKLYLYEKEVTREYLDEMHGLEQKYIDEGENIITCVMPLEEAAAKFKDAKCFAALYLYEKHKNQN